MLAPERHHYVDMIPLLQAAIALKQQEAEAEAPFRAALLAAIVRETGPDEQSAAADLDDLVSWFKIGNKWHRALSGDPEHEAKATRKIVAEAKRRAKADRSGVEKDAVAGLRAMYPRAMAVLRRLDGTYVVFEPQKRQYAVGMEYRNAPTPADVFVVQHEHKGTAEPVHTEWLTIPDAAARWRALWSAEQWDTYRRRVRPADFQTDAQIEHLIAATKVQVAAEHPGLTYLGTSLGKYHGGAVRVTVWSARLEAPEPPALPYSKPLEGVLLERYVGSLHLLDNQGSKPGWTDEVSIRDDNYHVGRWSARGDWGDKVGTEVPWSGRSNDGVFVEISSEGLFAARAEVVERDRLAEPGRRMRQYANDALTAAHKAWAGLWEAQQRVRFDEDFGDPDLWEGHLKALKIPQNPVDHSWAGVFGRLLERGVEVSGRTLADLHAEHTRLVGEPKVEKAWHAYGTTGKPLTVPESMEDVVVVVAAPEPEEEDEEQEAPLVDEEPAVEAFAMMVVRPDGTEVMGLRVE